MREKKRLVPIGIKICLVVFAVIFALSIVVAVWGFLARPESEWIVPFAEYADDFLHTPLGKNIWIYLVIVAFAPLLVFILLAIGIAAARRKFFLPEQALSKEEAFDLFADPAEEFVPVLPASEAAEREPGEQDAVEVITEFIEEDAESDEEVEEYPLDAKEPALEELPAAPAEIPVSAAKEPSPLDTRHRLEELLSFDPDAEIEKIKQKNALYAKRQPPAKPSFPAAVQEAYCNRNVDKDRE